MYLRSRRVYEIVTTHGWNGPRESRVRWSRSRWESGNLVSFSSIDSIDHFDISGNSRSKALNICGSAFLFAASIFSGRLDAHRDWIVNLRNTSALYRYAAQRLKPQKVSNVCRMLRARGNENIDDEDEKCPSTRTYFRTDASYACNQALWELYVDSLITLKAHSHLIKIWQSKVECEKDACNDLRS